MSGDDNTITWATLEASADAGTLFLDPAIGKDIPAAIDEMVRQVDSTRNAVERIGIITGYGNFKSSHLIKDKINKSVTVGEGSLAARAGQLADQFRDMKRVVEKSLRNYEQADRAHGENLAKFLSQWDAK